ncbi:putative WEB family protein at1g65010 chloroplastic [Phtheirospermum japonicum]|uniref:Putative WEB family protein at1g65010 chloroplastic n=1 Tax=Phtheirospermum japonicum TaxID=374723 RepID=A0A830CW73_9LAMI|nr:putative WEB family protein at1g65010 chloroplastic [Phtheirospermum japonicum]
MGEMEEELRRTKEKFNVSETEKYQILDQLKEAKQLAQEANMRANEALSPNNANELKREIERLKKSISNSLDEFRTKDKKIDSLESELGLARQLEAEKNASLDKLNNENNNTFNSEENDGASKEEISRLKSELQSAQEGEKNASLRAKSLLDEMEVLKNEWRLAIEAEEKSTKAMEDLALALKEVATESNQAKEKLNAAETELEHVRGEAEKLKNMVRNTEETYQNLLNEAKQESEKQKNTVDRLRLEAEETLLALSAKEMGFVSCIKQAEEERATAQRQNAKLSENLKAAENMTRTAREETYKLRDILKQAVNEANAAKAAAGIARDENSLLKDLISDKDERLHFLTRENERLRMCEAAANENVKQLKILLSRVSSTDFKNEEYKEFVDIDEDDDNNDDDDDEALRGSIFDANAETPKSEPRTPKTALSVRRYLEDGKVGRRSEDFDQLSDSDCSERGSHRRTKTMFQRVGDLLAIRRSYHRKEAAPIEHVISANAALN